MPGPDLPTLTLNQIFLTIRMAVAAGRDADVAVIWPELAASRRTAFAWRKIARGLEHPAGAPFAVRSAVAIGGTRLVAAVRCRRPPFRPTAVLGSLQSEGGIWMGLTSDRELHELLLIEEADAWFEYADATKIRDRDALRRDRAVGLGAPAAAAADRAHAARAARAGHRGGLTAQRVRSGRLLPLRKAMPLLSVSNRCARPLEARLRVPTI